MTDWTAQRLATDVAVGDKLEGFSIPITLQRLVMEAGANRDLSTIHHDREDAQATGAPDVYANTFFLLGLFERLLREWAGLRATISKIGPMQMRDFNCVGDTLTFGGEVAEISIETGRVQLELWAESAKGRTTLASAIVNLPVTGG